MIIYNDSWYDEVYMPPVTPEEDEGDDNTSGGDNTEPNG